MNNLADTGKSAHSPAARGKREGKQRVADCSIVTQAPIPLTLLLQENRIEGGNLPW